MGRADEKGGRVLFGRIGRTVKKGSWGRIDDK